jgi:hypothetical protein
MPSNSRLFVKPFIGGINTELSSVEDAILYTSDELNCTILPEGMRGRRLGFNIERDGAWSTETPTTSYSGFHWKNVNNLGIDIIIQQVNKKLYFYNVTGKPISATDRKVNFDRVFFATLHDDYEIRDRGYMGSVDISEYMISSVDETIEPLKYAIGSGYLFVVGSSIKPLKISYNSGSFKVEAFSLKVRDLSGIDDELEVDEMPPADPEKLETLKDLDIRHYYNLLNQGWIESDILQFAKDKTKYPSNNLQWFLGKDDSGKYNTEKLLQKYFGNTPAPRGHFIINYSTMSRADASGLYGVDPTVWSIYGDALMYVRNRKIRVRRSLWNIEQIYTTKEKRVLKKLTFKWDRLARKSAKKSHDNKWSGKITYQIYGLNTSTNTYDLIHSDSEIAYGASSENIYRVALDLTNNETAYNNYKVKVSFDDDSNGTPDIKHPTIVSANLLIYFEGDRTIDDWVKESVRGVNTPTDITSMSGRMFYLVNDTVLFSQVITETGDEYSKCYQDADPTSEELSDIIVTDGGYVKFNAMGAGKALQSFNRGVLVFGENVVYGLISPSDKTFSASEYDIIELSRAGIISGRSAVSTDNMVYYWSPLGIFRIGINPQTGSSLIAESVTHSTIQEWYDKIPEESKKTCRGCYDFVNNRIYWYYAQPDTDEEDFTKLNRCLVLDLTHNAFMPFKIDNSDEGVVDVFSVPSAYEISPTLYVRVNGNKVIADDQNVIAVEEDEEFKRWTSIQHIITNSEGSTAFGDYNSREYKDFDKYGYDSYMISRPIMFEGVSAYGNPINTTHTDKQVPILQTLFKRTEQAPLACIATPVEHVYKLKDDVSYISADPEYDITSGTLSKHSVAKAFIFNDKGLFKSCKIRVDVKDFKGKVIDLGAELICDKVSKKTINVYNKTVTNDYMDLEFDEALDTPHLNYAVRVVAEIRGGEIYKEKIHFTADFVQDRTSPLLPVFSGFKKIEVENTEKLYTVGDFDVKYKLSARIPSMYMTAFQIEAIPPEALEDKNWGVEWECRTDGNSNLFNVSRSYVSYGTSSKEYPTETAFDSSIQYVNNLSKFLKIGLKSYNYNRTDWKGTKVRYKIEGLVPEYKETEPVKSKANYIAPSGANIRMRWGWSLNDRSNRWDMVQNGYRPQKDFLYDEYVESRIHVRGRGKAFQVEVRNDDNKDFRLAGMNLVVRSK